MTRHNVYRVHTNCGERIEIGHSKLVVCNRLRTIGYKVYSADFIRYAWIDSDGEYPGYNNRSVLIKSR